MKLTRTCDTAKKNLKAGIFKVLERRVIIFFNWEVLERIQARNSFSREVVFLI